MNTEPITPSSSLADQSLNRPPMPFEQERLAALDRYGILDTPEEEPFDRHCQVVGLMDAFDRAA